MIRKYGVAPIVRSRFRHMAADAIRLRSSRSVADGRARSGRMAAEAARPVVDGLAMRIVTSAAPEPVSGCLPAAALRKRFGLAVHPETGAFPSGHEHSHVR